MKTVKAPFEKLLWACLVLALLLAWLHLKRYQVGLFVDDARFILRAISLGQGKYQALELPGHPPANIPSPGFPFFLLPFVAALAPHWGLLRWVALALTAGSTYFLWKILEGTESPWRTAIVALFALNPYTGAFASAVMAEPAVIFFSLGSLLAIRRLRDRPSEWKELLCGLLLGWTCLLRTETIVLLPILLWPLVPARRWASLTRMMGTALVLEGLVILRNQSLTNSASGYLSQWALSWKGAYVLPTLIAHWQRIADVVVGDALLGLSGYRVFDGHPRAGAAAIILAILFLGAALVAAIRSRDEEEGRPLQTIGLAGALLVVHSLWLSFSPLHFWPMLPGLLILLVLGLQRVSRIPGLKPIALGLPCLLGAAYVSAQVQSLQHPIPSLPIETLAWLRGQAGPDDIVFAPDAATVALLTGRPVISAHTAGGAETFQYHLLTSKVRWVVDRPFTPLFFPEALESAAYREGADAQAHRWLEESPQGFALVHRNEQEMTRIYEVMPSPALVNAFPLYEEGTKALRALDTKAGKPKLEEALRIYPTFESALRTLGTAYYLEGKMPAASRCLDQALRLRPNDPLLRLNRARLFVQSHRLPQAREEYRTAIALLSLPGELPSLRRAAQDELDHL